MVKQGCSESKLPTIIHRAYFVKVVHCRHPADMDAVFQLAGNLSNNSEGGSTDQSHGPSQIDSEAPGGHGCCARSCAHAAVAAHPSTAARAARIRGPKRRRTSTASCHGGGGPNPCHLSLFLASLSYCLVKFSVFVCWKTAFSREHIASTNPTHYNTLYTYANRPATTHPSPVATSAAAPAWRAGLQCSQPPAPAPSWCPLERGEGSAAGQRHRRRRSGRRSWPGQGGGGTSRAATAPRRVSYLPALLRQSLETV